MKKHTRINRPTPFILFLLAATYCLASLAHFVHNAEYLSAYPNLPPWLSRSQIYAIWLAITAIGVVGLWLARGKYSMLGLILIAVYALIGFDGLGHYAVAPMSAHTFTINFTIWAEVVAAAFLLIETLRCIWDHFQNKLRSRPMPNVSLQQTRYSPRKK